VVKITAQLCGVLFAARRFASKAVFKYRRCAIEAGSGLTSVKSHDNPRRLSSSQFSFS
jgi:hypothetical protein